MQYRPNPSLIAESPKFYRNSSVIVDLAIGQRSTERISSYEIPCTVR